MMAFILATGFDFIAYMSKMAFFGSFFHANGVFGMIYMFGKITTRVISHSPHTHDRYNSPTVRHHVRGHY